MGQLSAVSSQLSASLFALAQRLYCKRSESAGCSRSLSLLRSSSLRSSYSRPSTLDHAEARSDGLPPTRDQSLPASAVPVPARFVSGSWTPSATHTATGLPSCDRYPAGPNVHRLASDTCAGICILKRRQWFAPLVVVWQDDSDFRPNGTECGSSNAYCRAGRGNRIACR